MKRRMRPMRRASKRRRGGRFPRKIRGRKRTNRTYLFKRRAFIANIVGSEVAGVPTDQFGGRTFTLNDLPNVSEFTNLFDKYKICGIRLEFRLSRSPDGATPSGGTAANVGIYPRLYSVVDHDTSSAPTAFDQLREYPGCKEMAFVDGRPKWFYFRPSVLTEVYRTAITTGLAPRKAPYVDSAYTDLQHFGWRYGVTGLPTGYTILVEAVYFIACKDVF